MGVQSRNAPLPPVRKWWVERMSPADRRSHLLAERLEALAESRPSEEAAAIRGFLRQFRKATADGNPAGFILKIKVPRKVGTHAAVFAECPGVGRVRWLPVLVVPVSDHLQRIMRECGDLPLFPHDRVRKTDVWGEPESQRGGFPPTLDPNIWSQRIP